MIKRENIYLGIKNDRGVITPLVGVYDHNQVRNLENGELLNKTGYIYGVLDGFPSCSLDQILAAWKFKKELTEEEVHMITTIFQYPELVQREMERINLDLLNQDDLWMLEHVYIMTKNTNIRKQFMDEIDEQNNVYCRHIFQSCMKSKQKRKEWR